MVIVHVVVTVLLGAGVFFTLVGSIGLLRFPDFYTRLHATGKCDTLGGGLIILGAMIYHFFQYPETLLVPAKLAFLIFFIFIANPTATHAIMKAAYKTGVETLAFGGGEEMRLRERSVRNSPHLLHHGRILDPSVRDLRCLPSHLRTGLLRHCEHHLP